MTLLWQPITLAITLRRVRADAQRRQMFLSSLQTIQTSATMHKQKQKQTIVQQLHTKIECTDKLNIYLKNTQVKILTFPLRSSCSFD